MGKQFADVNSQYGAPMGRREYFEEDIIPCRCFRVRMVDGAYDDGGAYWGCGVPLYAAIADGVQIFTRARSRKTAKEEFRKRYETIKFKN